MTGFQSVFGWLFIVLVSTSPALAQREVRIRMLPETPLPYLTTVTSPAARFAAVCDASDVLAVGHRPKQPQQTSLFRLDAQGQIVPGEPIPVTLPKPAALADRPNFALGITCHPRLPLLYVWQDVEPLPDNKPTDPAVSAEFDHLLIYSLEDPQPKLLLATARGPDFGCGNAFGGFTLNATSSRLYIPNMQQMDRVKKVMVSAIGWIILDADGLPAFAPPNSPPEDATAKSAVTPLELPAAAAARSAKLAELEQARAAGMPLVLRKYLELTVYSFTYPPSPYNYAPWNDDAIFLAGHSGPVSWVLSDRLGRFNTFYLPPYVPYRYRVTVHPVLPSVYTVPVTYDGRMSRLEHADGQFTLTPQVLLLDNMVFHSPALVLAKPNQLLIGAAGRVCVVDLDAEGRFRGTAVQMTVPNPTVEALCWSEKFQKLYVPVEKVP